MADAEPKTAVLFPGQGSQAPGMRDAVAALRPDLLELAAEACGDDPFERIGDGTRFQQPAILCASLAGWELAREQRPAALAGHSLGELGALAAAGVLRERDAVELVALRGRACAAAGADGPPAGMLAVRAGTEAVAAVARRAGVAVANENAPDQTVLSGPLDTLDGVAAELRERGIRSLRLPVDGAFHSPAMAPAAAELAAALRDVDLRPPRIAVLSCMTAMPFADPRVELVAALTRPVRWVSTLRALADLGVERFVETGPGNVLAKLAPKSVPGATALTVDPAEVARA